MSGPKFAGRITLNRSVPAAAFLAVAIIACGVAGCGSRAAQPSGTIVFGTSFQRLSAYQFVIQNERSTFRDGAWMGWVAQLEHALDSHSVTITVVDAKSKRVIWQEVSTGENPKFVELASHVPVDSFVKVGATVPGTYELEYSTGNTVLAKGTFKISG